MAEPPETEREAETDEPAAPDAGDDEGALAGEEGSGGAASTDPGTLRERVEAEYDLEEFSPADMAEMTVEEWEAAFDPDRWITGPDLLDRVEAELRRRVADRTLFAVVERIEGPDGGHVLAYDDRGYVTVSPDGDLEGEGAILEDVEPVVALCSMADYDVAEPPADAGLPEPGAVDSGGGGLGHRLVMVVAAVQIVAGVVLLVAPVVVGNPGGGSTLLTTVAGLGFLVIGIVLGVLVANARLSNRFRAEEYRGRLRAAGVGTGERPDWLPPEALGAGNADAGAGEDAGRGDANGAAEAGTDSPESPGESSPD